MRPFYYAVLGLALIVVSAAGFIYLPRGFQEISSLDSIRMVRWVSNPLWDAMPFLGLAGAVLISWSLSKINALKTLSISLAISLAAFSPLLIPPRHAENVPTEDASLIQQEFAHHLDAPWLVVVRVVSLGGRYPTYDGVIEVYSLFYLKFGVYRNGEGLVIDPLANLLIIPLTLLAYTSVIITIASALHVLARRWFEQNRLRETLEDANNPARES